MPRPCPCGRKLTYETCCGPFLAGAALPPTAAALMRSRYTAYGEGAVDYLVATTAPERRGALDAAELRAYCAKLRLVRLEILDTRAGGPDDAEGEVLFRATLRHDGRKFEQVERSRFVREPGRGAAPEAGPAAELGRWVYLDAVDAPDGAP